MRRSRALPPTIALAIALLAAGPALAQDMKPDPADVAAIKALLEKANRAMVGKDQKTFLACCDDYVDCFFLDGTLIKGKKRIAATLYEFFRNRPPNLEATHGPVPRSYRVLSPDVIMVDWPATIKESGATATVNTLTTVRKVKGEWLITSYLESVPYRGRIGGRNAAPGQP